MAESTEQDPGRKRPFKPKTRTGCITCRIRRVKCDEAKPACLKCTRTGRECDGYNGVPPPRTSRTLPLNTNTTNTSTTLVPLKPIAPRCQMSVPQITVIPFKGTGSEIRAFRYFQEETVPQICGFYRDQFWFYSVLQACHHDVAIRHAAVALGAFHEQTSTAGSSPHDENSVVGESFALQQYNKAIQALLNPVPGSAEKSAQKIDVALITCVLFACFDALRGHLKTVFDHIDGGVKILSELQRKATDYTQKSQSSSLYAPISSLNKLFTRLDIQGSSMVGTRRLQLVPDLNLGPSIESITIPTIFTTFEEARDAQDSISRCWHHDFRRTLTSGAEIPFLEVPSKEESQYLKQSFNSKLTSWNAVYSKFLLAHPEKKDEPANHLLLLCNTFIWLQVNVDHAAVAESEMIWDQYTPQFALIIQHATHIILPSSSSTIPQPRILFSLDNTLISTLYFVASRCRHPIVRRAAIRCLKTANRQEGLWDSRTLARVARRVMEIEEEGMGDVSDGTEIPGWKRVCGVFPVLDPDARRAVVRYSLKERSREEEIEW